MRVPNQLDENLEKASRVDTPVSAGRDRSGGQESARTVAHGGEQQLGVGRMSISRFFGRPLAGAAVGAVAVYIVFAFSAYSHGFVNLNGTAAWLDTAAELGIVAVPVGLLMIAGEFDLSIASVIAASALTVSIGSGHYGLPLLVSIGMALAGATAIGLLNGIVTVRTGVPSFIVTLASYFGLGGASLALTSLLTGSATVSLNTSGWLHALFAASPHQFNVSILWCAAVVLSGAYVLSRTVFGNWLQATGGDKLAAREAGVPTAKVKITLFVASSLGAALLGIIQAVEYSGANVGQGTNFIFETIVAVVVGGVFMQGGYGSVFGILFGAMTYSIVSVGVYYTGWNSNLTQLFIGVLILGAVLANNSLRQMAMGRTGLRRVRHGR